MGWRPGNHYRIHVYEDDRPVATFHDAEDAEITVRAVNAHEALVEALAWVRVNYASAPTKDINAKLDAALALARGEQS